MMEKSEYNVSFGKYIKSLRNLKGWSQIDLSEKLGNNYQNVSAIERGEYSIILYSTQKIADAFEIPLSTLILGFEESIKEEDKTSGEVK